MGIETEYGVLQPGRPQANPMVLSSHVVSAYAAVHAASRARWDYADEDPLADARGFRMPRAAAHPSQLTDDPTLAAPSGDEPLTPDEVERPLVGEDDDPGAATSILSNSAPLYVDHA
ncbi:MAG TPA: proteasome accessory factor PafA2 family protein, partial [Actinotalea sp.]|nr:proteasome accessory factor PafA2 family protein [Actinotalea sp.]